jgi:hypothetical protein
MSGGDPQSRKAEYLKAVATLLEFCRAHGPGMKVRRNSRAQLQPALLNNEP